MLIDLLSLIGVLGAINVFRMVLSDKTMAVKVDENSANKTALCKFQDCGIKVMVLIG